VALLWLKDSSQTALAVSMLETASPAVSNVAGIGEIFWGQRINVCHTADKAIGECLRHSHA